MHMILLAHTFRTSGLFTDVGRIIQIARHRIKLLHTSLSWSTPRVVVSDDRKKLSLILEEESDKHFHGVWLRHNCHCSVCFSQEASMSRITPEQLEGVKIDSAHMEGDSVYVNWSARNGGTHEGIFSVHWLNENDYSSQESFERRRSARKPLVATELPRIAFSEVVCSDEGFFSWLRQVNFFGLSLIEGVPSEKSIERISNKFSHIQHTIYGETYEIKTMENPEVADLGYSNEELQLHQDLLFYECPPGMECFHCIQFDECVEGGESVMLDTLPVLNEMRSKHPKLFQTLTQVPVTFQRVQHKGENASDLKIGRPHVILDRYNEIAAVNWNPHHQDTLFTAEDKVEDYYEAFFTLNRMFAESPLKITHRMKEGEALFFNNRRFLHGRSGFKLNGGLRHFKGFYINIDYLRSEFQVYSSKLDKGEESKHVFSNST